MIIDYSELTQELVKQGCFVLNMTNEAYHEHYGLSKSGMDLVNKSPAHWFASAKQTKTKRHFDIGTAVHCAVLEPERFKDEYMLLREVETRVKSEYKQAIKSHEASRVLVAGEVANIESLQSVIQSSPTIKHAIDSCDLFEVSAFCTCPETGSILKCRYDALSVDNCYSLDLKTTRDSSREDFAKSVFNYRYHVQDAHYSRVFEIITGNKLAFEFLAIENDPPHCPMIYRLDDEAKQIGLSEALRNGQDYRECQLSMDWKGYEQTDEPLSLPSWALARYENQLDEDIV